MCNPDIRAALDIGSGEWRGGREGGTEISDKDIQLYLLVAVARLRQAVLVAILKIPSQNRSPSYCTGGIPPSPSCKPQGANHDTDIGNADIFQNIIAKCKQKVIQIITRSTALHSGLPYATPENQRVVLGTCSLLTEGISNCDLQVAVYGRLKKILVRPTNRQARGTNTPPAQGG